MLNQRLNTSSQLWIKLNWNQSNLSIVYWFVYWAVYSSRWDDRIILKSLHKKMLKFASNAEMLAWLKCERIERSKTRKIDFCASNSIDISDYSILTNLNLRRLSSFFACLLIRIALWTLCVFETKASLSCHLLLFKQWADNSSLICFSELSLSISIVLRRHVSALCRLLIFRWWVIESSAYCYCITSFDDLNWIQSFWTDLIIKWISCRRVIVGLA
jgi:hypothetical protein